MTLILDIQVAKAWVLLFILAVIVYFFIVNWISFPSYNIAISLIALHSGAQEETQLLLKVARLASHQYWQMM